MLSIMNLRRAIVGAASPVLRRRGNPGAGRRRGAAMVEFALVFILFLSLVIVLFEGARAIWTYTTLMHASREATRFATTKGQANPTDAAAILAVARANAVGLPAASVTILTNYSPTLDRDDQFAVRVLHPYRFLFLFAYTTTMRSTTLGVISTN